VEKPDWDGPLAVAHEYATAYLRSLPERRVGVNVGIDELRRRFDVGLSDAGEGDLVAVEGLIAAADEGVVASGSGRFYGFVIGGATPAALAADWLTSVWDQNAGIYATSPAAAVAEEVASRWILELLGLPPESAVGFVTGAQMATATSLAAARHEVLRRRGWDVEVQGLAGAPRIAIVVGAQRHSTIDRAVRLLGLGSGNVVAVDVDEQGRLRPDALASTLDSLDGPVIVCAQAGNIDTGSVDPMREVCELAHAAGAWVHVDGAFGLWAAASPRLSQLVAGVELADSWTTDAHKWLNVTYDSGIAICRHPAPLRAAMGVRASYLVHAASGERDAIDVNPEFSRRARGFAIYATLRALGRDGVAELVDRCCHLAGRFAAALATAPGLTVLNDVVLNQVLVGLAEGDAYELAGRIRQDGTCFMTATTWNGRPALRISVSNWTTDEADVDRSVEAILRALPTV